MIRFASPNDADAVLEIYSPAILSTAASFDEVMPSPAEIRARIERTIPKYPWLVFERNDEVIGYAYASPHRDRASYRWSVDVSVYIRQDSHGQGIGRALYAQLFPILRAQKFHRAYAGITLPNAGSVALHESFGFKQIAIYTEVGFKFGAWHDVGWWELELSSLSTSPQEPLAISAVSPVSFAR